MPCSYGGAVNLDPEGSFECTDCSFTGNSADVSTLPLPACSLLLLLTRARSDQVGGAINNYKGSLNLILCARPLPLCLMAQDPSSHFLLHLQPDVQRQQGRGCHRRARLLLLQPEALRLLHLPQGPRHEHVLHVRPG